LYFVYASGEPLHNYEAVISAVRAMAEGRLFNLSRNRITVSTVGIIPRMRQLTREAPYVTLALSLHAPTQELRTQIVPSAKTYHLEELMAALDAHVSDSPNRRVLVEYVMLKDVNDSDEVAHQLGKLLKGRRVHLNLIPYNPTDVIEKYQKPASDRISQFHGILINEEYGIFTTIRAEHGSDIAGACGQLAVQKQACDSKDCATDHKHEHKQALNCDSKAQDIEDLGKPTERKFPKTIASTSAVASTSTESFLPSRPTNTSEPPTVAVTSTISELPDRKMTRIALLIVLIAIGVTLLLRVSS